MRYKIALNENGKIILESINVALDPIVDELFFNSILAWTPCVLKNGKAYAWGYNFYGAIGNNSIVSKSTPVAVYGNHTFCQIVSEIQHVFALDNHNKSWTWGQNNVGQLGVNSTTCYSTPIAVCGNHTFCKIYVSSAYSSFGIDNNGKAWAWGFNSNGKLGNNSASSVRTPVSIYGNHTFCQLAAAATSTYGLDYNGKIWSWGANRYGQLGNNQGGSTLSTRTPIAVCGNHTFCKIVSIGDDFIIALDYNGKAWAWGINTSGQLGTNNLTNYSTPVAVCGNHSFCDLSLSVGISILKDNNNLFWGIGKNDFGQLGQNNVNCYSTPVCLNFNQIFNRINSSAMCTYAVDDLNNLWAWGYNDYGNLGNNNVITYSTPVAVCSF